MVSLGVVWGHWWLQCQGKLQYLQNTCASFFLHVLSLKTQTTSRPLPAQNLRCPPSAKQHNEKTSPFETKLTEHKLLFHKHRSVKYWKKLVICIGLPVVITILTISRFSGVICVKHDITETVSEKSYQCKSSCLFSQKASEWIMTVPDESSPSTVTKTKVFALTIKKKNPFIVWHCT